MTYTINMDSAGRLVLPKALRERYGLAGAAHRLEVSDTSEGIVLRPKCDWIPFVRDASGWMVFQSGEEDAIDPVAAVDEARSARSRVVAGED